MPFNKFLPLFLPGFLLLPFSTAAQDIMIDTWRVHLPYRDGIAVTEGTDRIFAASMAGMFSYDLLDGSIERMSKTNGFSDVQVSTLRYNLDKKLLLIAYKSTKIDMMLEDNTIIIMSDILRKSIIGEKKINHIYYYGDKAYIAGTFGLSVMDLDKREFSETYLGEDSAGSGINVTSSAIFNNYLYAATPNGFMIAPMSNPNLINIAAWDTTLTGKNVRMVTAFSNKLYADIDSILMVFDGSQWNPLNGYKKRNTGSIEVCHGKLIIALDSMMIIDMSGNVTFKNNNQPNQTILDKDGNFWTVKDLYGLIKMDPTGQEFFLNPNGPYSTTASQFANYEDEMWVATYSLPDAGFINLGYNRDGIAVFDNTNWAHYNSSNTPFMDSVLDMNCVAIDKKTGVKYFGSFRAGMLELNNGTFTLYDNSNSSLQRQPLGLSVTGIAVDDSSNVWVSNFRGSSPISVKRANNTWQSYSIDPYSNMVFSVLIDDFDQKWIISVNAGILVFDEKKGPAGMRLLGTAPGSGSLPSQNVVCMAKDADGEIWVGTAKGLVIFSNPGGALTQQVFDAHPIKIGKGGTELLLGTESINDIKVDGGDSKWVATRNGVWLFSPDGMRVIRQFNMSNSPLLSNNVMSIGINERSGEVFFGTDKGIISYRGKATTGSDKHGDVYAFPNPVKPGYEGLIAIQGLVSNASVKITDVTGGLIYETFAEGGTATWDGKNFSGQRASSGVYLVFSTNKDGTETFVTKILIVN